LWEIPVNQLAAVVDLCYIFTSIIRLSNAQPSLTHSYITGMSRPNCPMPPMQWPSATWPTHSQAFWAHAAALNQFELVLHRHVVSNML